jgi:hypothetical protein
LTGNVNISTSATAQIQHVGSFKWVLRETKTTTIVLGNDFWVNVVDGLLDERWRSSSSTASVGFQISRVGKFLAVVILDGSSGGFID